MELAGSAGVCRADGNAGACVYAGDIIGSDPTGQQELSLEPRGLVLERVRAGHVGSGGRSPAGRRQSAKHKSGLRRTPADGKDPRCYGQDEGNPGVGVRLQLAIVLTEHNRHRVETFGRELELVAARIPVMAYGFLRCTA